MKTNVKKFIQDTLFRLFPSSAVLMLHNISDTPIISKEILLSEERFYQMVDSFSNWDSIESIHAKPHHKKMAITFDDGFSDVYTIAYPYLNARSIPFTCFVTVEKLDTVGYLTTGQLIELSKNPIVTIGAHCWHHKPLAGMHADQQAYELFATKEKLEKIIGKKILYMAYPYGQRDTTTMQLLRKNKDSYAGCFIVGRGLVNIITSLNKFELPRMGMDNSCFLKNMQYLKKYFY